MTSCFEHQKLTTKTQGKIMANGKYDPKLSEAGFMDLVLALQQQLKQPDTRKLLATKPPGQVAAIRALERAAIAYVDVAEGRGEKSPCTCLTGQLGPDYCDRHAE
jgi:hypothetical protein